MRIVRWLPVVAIVLVLAACGGTSEPAVHVRTARQVVVAYIAAFNAHHRSAALSKLTPRFARLALRDSGAWSDGSVKITRLRMGEQSYDPTYRFAADVVASVVVVDRHPGAKRRRRDIEIFSLVRESPTDPWLIDDESNG